MRKGELHDPPVASTVKILERLRVRAKRTVAGEVGTTGEFQRGVFALPTDRNPDVPRLEFRRRAGQEQRVVNLTSVLVPATGQTEKPTAVDVSLERFLDEPRLEPWGFLGVANCRSQHPVLGQGPVERSLPSVTQFASGRVRHKANRLTAKGRCQDILQCQTDGVCVQFASTAGEREKRFLS